MPAVTYTLAIHNPTIEFEIGCSSDRHYKTSSIEFSRRDLPAFVTPAALSAAFDPTLAVDVDDMAAAW